MVKVRKADRGTIPRKYRLCDNYQLLRTKSISDDIENTERYVEFKIVKKKNATTQTYEDVKKIGMEKKKRKRNKKKNENKLKITKIEKVKIDLSRF